MAQVHSEANPKTPPRDFGAHQLERSFGIAVIGAEEQSLLERCRGATEIARALHAGPHTTQVRKRAIEAGIGVNESAIGESLEHLDRFAQRTIAQSGHPLLKERRRVVIGPRDRAGRKHEHRQCQDSAYACRAEARHDVTFFRRVKSARSGE